MNNENQNIEEIKNRHISSPRNKLIANAFYRAGFIEHWGRGVEKICTAFKNVGLAEPIYENICNGIKITIPRNKELTKENLKLGDTKSPLSDVRKQILELMKADSRISITQIAGKLRYSTTAIEKNIDYLKENGYLKRNGTPKNGHWEIK